MSFSAISFPKMSPHIQSVKYGNNAVITCLHDKPLTWSFNDGSLPPNIRVGWDPGAKYSPKNSILIQHFHVVNIGYYKCGFEDEDHQLVLYDVGHISLLPRSMEEFKFIDSEISMHFITSKSMLSVILNNWLLKLYFKLLANFIRMKQCLTCT